MILGVCMGVLKDWRFCEYSWEGVKTRLEANANSARYWFEPGAAVGLMILRGLDLENSTQALIMDRVQLGELRWGKKNTVHSATERILTASNLEGAPCFIRGASSLDASIALETRVEMFLWIADRGSR